MEKTMEEKISDKLLNNMRERGVDVPLTLSILSDYNQGTLGRASSLAFSRIPAVDGERVVALRTLSSIKVKTDELEARLSALGVGALFPRLFGHGPIAGEFTELRRADIELIGKLVYPLTAFGILAGGGATSYADTKRNQALSPALFSRYRRVFEAEAERSGGKPKGCANAFFNQDGSPGASFFRLKQRALLIKTREWQDAYREAFGMRLRAVDAAGGGFPLQPFGMTSAANHQTVQGYLRGAGEDELTAGLMRDCGVDMGEFLLAQQSLIAAYSHSEKGERKTVFDRAYGQADSCLPLPGGHGQNFYALADIYRGLRAAGKRYAYLTNVDNLGALPDPIELGLLAVTGRPAGFDFSFRTPVDVKGGILAEDAAGQLSCGDIGSALSFSDIQKAEAQGGQALFNCATGLFDLDWLCPLLPELPRLIPTRFSDQDKDAGRYSQAEQNTWEIIGLAPDCRIFAVEKAERFLAAKLLLENIITSLPPSTSEDGALSEADRALARTGRELRNGQRKLLIESYGLALPPLGQ
jgi:hypothetical protein